MRRARPSTPLALFALCLAAGCASADTARPAVSTASVAASPPALEDFGRDPIDSDRYRSVLVVDVDALRHIDPQAPRDALVRDVVGADPLLAALLPSGFRSLADIERIEYRARAFAGRSWSLTMRFDRPVSAALAARDLPSPGAQPTSALPSAHPSLAGALGERTLVVAPAEAFAESLQDAAAPAHIRLEPGELATWRLTHVDEEFEGQGQALPRELLLGARRGRSPATILLAIRALYSDRPSAEAGLRHWEGLRQGLVDNPWVMLSGVDRPLAERSLRLEETTVSFHTSLRPNELRVVLAAVASMHGRPEGSLPDDT